MTKHIVILLEDKGERVGSVLAQTLFKNAIERLTSGQVNVWVTDIRSWREDLNHLDMIHYLMLNEPTINLQDKHNPEYYWSEVDSIRDDLLSAEGEVGLQLHGEHTFISSYIDKYDDYWKMVDQKVGEIWQITPELAEKSKTHLGRHVGVLPSTGLIDNSVIYSEKDPTKPICWVGRVAPSKKPVQFLRLMNSIYPDQPDPFTIYGEVSPGIHNVALDHEWSLTQFDRSLIEAGSYEVEVYDGGFLNPSKHHFLAWGGTQNGRGNTCEFTPRIELAMIEALRGGCIPILFNETVPEYFNEDSYVGIDWLDINHISKVEGLRRSADKIALAAYNATRMHPSDTIELCRQGLESISIGLNPTERYLEFINKL